MLSCLDSELNTSCLYVICFDSRLNDYQLSAGADCEYIHTYTDYVLRSKDAQTARLCTQRWSGHITIVRSVCQLLSALITQLATIHYSVVCVLEYIPHIFS